jgi:hypothetical protein
VLILLLAATAAIAVSAVAPGEALALRRQPRPDYMAGVGWGFGRGVFNSPDGGQQEYSEGGIPLIRFGRMIGDKAMLAINYSGWVIEYSDSTWDWVTDSEHHLFASGPEDSTVIKNRRSQQQLALSLYWFPGNPAGVSGGTYLRVGAGLGWAGTNEVLIEADNPQGHGSRIDEWGWGFSVEAGYEFWIARFATLGGGVFYDYMSVKETIVDDGWFTGAALNFNVYF